MPAIKTELPLRIVVDDPVPGVALAVQNGKARAFELVPPARASAEAAVFEVSVTATLAEDGAARLTGPIAQGAPAQRFVYVNVGTSAGQCGSPWSRRLKFPLTGITSAQVKALKPGQRLEAHVAGRDKKGEPACASVKLTQGWKAK